MKVVLALDDSPYSQHVLDCVCRRHWPADTEFKVLCVIEPIGIEDQEERYNLGETLRSVERRRHQNAEDICAAARLRLEEHVPSSIVHFEVTKGDPRERIIESAAQWDADRILLGAKGRDICPHNLLGSVSSSVARHALCSVEVIRPIRAKRKLAKIAAPKAAQKR